MGTPGETQLSSIALIREQVALALQQAREALTGGAADASAIARAVSSLREARGAFVITGLRAPVRFIEEVEGLVADRDSAPEGLNVETISIACHAIDVLDRLLQSVADGAAYRPLALYPVYRGLCAARGRDCSDIELYFPDLSLGIAPELGSDTEWPATVERLTRFQGGLLRFLKGEAVAAEDMRGALKGIRRIATTPAQHSFWWTVEALLDAVAAGGLGPELSLKRLCGRVELEFRRLCDGRGDVPDSVRSEVLYHIAKAKPVTASVRSVKAAFRLEGSLDGEARAEVDEATRAAGLDAARQTVLAAQGAWERYSTGEASALAEFRTHAGRLVEESDAIGSRSCAELIAIVQLLAGAIPGDAAAADADVAEDVVGSLTLAEAILADPDRLEGRFENQIRTLTDRASARRGGRTLPISAIELGAMHGAEHLEAASAEIAKVMQEIEQVVEAAFSDPAKRSELSSLNARFSQVIGVLVVLGEAEAAREAEQCHARIKQLGASAIPSDSPDWARAAEALAALGARIQTIGRSGAVQLNNVDLPSAEPEMTPPVPEVVEEPAVPELDDVTRELREVFLEEAAELLAAMDIHLQKLRASPGERAPLVEIRRAFHTLKGSGRIACLPELGETAWCVERLVNGWLEAKRDICTELVELVDRARTLFQEWTTQLRTGAASVDPRQLEADAEALQSGRAPAASAVGETARLAQSTTAASVSINPSVSIGGVNLSLDLYQIFIAEARRHIATLIRQTDALPGEPGAPLPEEFLRAAHTLGGIAATAQMQALSELGYALEATLQRTAARERASDAELADLVRRAVTQAAGMVEAIGAKRQPVADADLLQALHDAPHEVPESADAGQNVPGFDPFGGGDDNAAPEQLALLAEGPGGPPRSLQQEPSLQQEMESEARADPHPGQLSLLVPTPSGPMGEEAPGLRPVVRPVGPAVTVLDGGAEESTTVLIQTRTGVIPLDGTVSPVTTLPAVAELTGTWARAIPSYGLTERTATNIPSSTVSSLTIPPVEQPAPMERRKDRVVDDIDEELLPVFLEEADGLSPQAEQCLRQLTETPDAAEPLASVKRILHTLKGSARMAGAMVAGELAHAMETRIESLERDSSVAPSVLGDLQAFLDRFIGLLDRLRERAVSQAQPKTETTAQGAVQSEPDARRAVLRVRADLLDRLVNQAGEVSVARSRIQGEVRALRGAMVDLTDNVTRLRAQLRDIEIQAEAQLQSSVSRDGEGMFDPLEFDRFTRFQELARAMAESVNDVATVQETLARALEHSEAALLAQGRLSRELQDGLMAVRLVPFSSLADRLHRIVRQTSKELGKSVRLDIEGGQIELDRSVLERMTAPFEHLLRNAITHGIEHPSRRAALSKPALGQIRIELRHYGNEVQLAVSDDGGGLDLDAIRARALEKELLDAAQEWSPHQLAELIFMPGFSTAEQVTLTAGRGVGMDVVKNEVSALGGRVDVEFERDKGTLFIIRLPLTLGVKRCLLVEVGDSIYGLPLQMVEQVMTFKADVIASLQETRVAEWQGRRYPFQYLTELLGAGSHAPDPARGVPMLMVRSGTEHLALRVDRIAGIHDLVTKRLGTQLESVPGVNGAAVLGTGRIALLINPVELANRAASRADRRVIAAQAAGQRRQPRILVVDDSLTVRKVTSRLLSRAGYEVATAKDGVDALNQLETTTPDVMLVDIEMPRMDGFELTRNVRANSRWAAIPILMVTSRDADKHKSYAFELGVNAFMGKPYQEEALLAQVAAFLEARTQTRAA